MSLRGYLFGARSLPRLALPASPEAASRLLRQLAATMAEAAVDPEGSANRRERSVAESLGLPAGYAFLWQFLEHDLVFDPWAGNAASGVGRLPFADLQSVYGCGPQEQPYLFAEDGARFLLGRAEDGTDDLPRNAPGVGPARALIPQGRNDENLLLGQLHLAFLKFHNAVCGALLMEPTLGARHVPGPVPVGQGAGSRTALFETARQVVIRHYQWMLLEDFLPRLVGPAALRALRGEGPRLLRFDSAGQAFLPWEFLLGACACRHATVRFDYDLNASSGRGFRAETGPAGDLRGARRRPAGLQVEWHRFFSLPGHPEPVWCMPFDCGISPALDAAEGAAGPLPWRVLRQGWQAGLASGQDLARHAGVEPTAILTRDRAVVVLTNDLWQEALETESAYDLEGRALVTGNGQAVLRETGRLTRVKVPGAREETLSLALGDATPLWYYLLKEAEVRCAGLHLGPLGGLIFAETLLALLAVDPSGLLVTAPGWMPTPGEFGAGGTPGRPLFGMAQLLAFARAPL